MRLIYFLASVIVLIAGYVVEGGRLEVLIQPVLLIAILLSLLLILSGKYGVKVTSKNLLGIGDVSRGFVVDAVFVCSTLGAIIFAGGVLVALGHLTSGYETIGHSVAASLVALVFSFGFSLYLSSLSPPSVSEPDKLLGKVAPAMIATTSTSSLFLGLIWLISRR